MSNTRSFMSIQSVVFAMLATAVFAGLMSAADFRGKFTLPAEAKWGTATLPAGDYEFTINTDVAPYTAKVSGKGGTASIFASGINGASAAGDSELVVARSGKTIRVRALHLAGPQMGLVLTYAAPRNERPMLAEAPELFQRFPIIASAK